MTDLPGLPRAAIGPWLVANLGERLDGGEWSAALIAGGRSNLTYRLHTSTGGLILRRPPLGGVLQSAHDMAREVRVLRALAPTDVPVPPVLALVTDEDVLGAPFYVMGEVGGEVFRTEADTAMLNVDQCAAIGEQLWMVLANLHLLDPESVGLGDFGRHTGYAARQLSRWTRQWVSTRTGESPDMDELIRRLNEQIPPDSRVSIVHGDYRLDNTIVDMQARPRVAAVVDWELSTLGDPLVDLGLTLVYWHDLGDEQRAMINVARGVTAQPGFPTADEFARAYAAKTGLDLENLAFYQALAAMKLAAILQGVHLRFVQGHTGGGEFYEGIDEAIPTLIARGLQILGLSSSRDHGSRR